MKNQLIFFIGLLGVLLFIGTTLLGGFLIEDYNSLEQFISESYAIDTEHGLLLRILGFIPSGMLLTVFCFLAPKYLQTSKQTKFGFYGVGLFYGIATIVVSIFPCDSGCNRELIAPSISQLVHNFIGALTYTLVPIFILLVGFGLKSAHKTLSIQSFVLGGLSIFFVFILMGNSNSHFIGLYQRIIESIFLLWFILCAFRIKDLSLFNSKS